MSVSEQPGLLFLSYASEDHVFAEWLERKLVALGYAVCWVVLIYALHRGLYN